MKDNKTNAIIAGLCLVAAVIMTAALSFAIGKWSFGGSRYDLTIQFPNATGISANSAVKYAGATVGRVKDVRLIARKDQKPDPATQQLNCVEVVVEIDKSLEVGSDTTAIIRQDGIGIAAKYVLLTPGPNPNSPVLPDGAVMQGKTPFDLSDLIQPAGEALTTAKALVVQMQPIMNRLDGLSQTLQTTLPPLINHADKFLADGDGVIANFNTPESRERLNDMLANLRVSTENLKVVSSNAKALTATLADKPWRVFWGGPTVPAPSEADVLKSDHVIRLKPDVEVNGAAPATK